MVNKQLKFQEFLFWHQQAAEKEKLWLEMNQDWMEEQQRRQERNAVLAAVRIRALVRVA